VLELQPDQVKVIGTPIPACDSDPIPRDDQAQNMGGFLAGLGGALSAPAVAVGQERPLVSDAAFTHWVVEHGQLVGEARSVKAASDGQSLAFVRLFAMPEMAESGYIDSSKLRRKTAEA
jgi:hypothetical protein